MGALPTSAAELLGRAESLTELLRAEAPANDSLGHLNDNTVDALRSAGLLNFCAPEEHGGCGIPPLEALRILETIAIADGSAGWVAMVTNSLAMMLSYLDPAVAARLCEQGTPMIAGQGAPTGRATPAEGGFRISGRWSYASGFHVADLILGTCLITRPDGSPQLDANGAPQVRVFLVPRTHVQAAGNWNVLGLRATGSVDYTIESVIVPGDNGIDLTGAPTHGGPFAMIGFPAWALLGHTAAALGVARHALDEAVVIASSAKGPFAPPAYNERVQAAYAKIEAALRSARAFVYEQWSDLEASILAGEPFSTRHQTMLHLALLHATTIAEQVATWSYRVGGGTALRDSALQRCLRDVHAVTQHVLVGDSFYKDCGQELLGAAEGKTWGLLGLS
ncbi:acyl-CoA dehydrogenase family protein [Nocardia sp. NPDC051900]|uniref:acyl-CoA dehydrogenase family protein n=1 Tax=Nocardia sp. NPDC051900 TaxID=3364326 RepID=UPI0037B0F443